MKLFMKLSIFFLTLILGSMFIFTSSFKTTTSDIQKTNNISIYDEDGYSVIIMDKKDMKFGVSEGKPDTADFFINSNFFENDGPIGLVVVDGIRQSDRRSGGGYFYVKNGIPYVRSKFCPKKTEFASQTILWAIDDGKINEDLLEEYYAKLERHRIIIGENAQGQIMIIGSNGYFSLVTVEEIINFAKEKGMVEGILLDGGSSVDYKCTNGTDTAEFASVPENLKPAFGITKPFTYIYGNLK